MAFTDLGEGILEEFAYTAAIATNDAEVSYEIWRQGKLTAYAELEASPVRKCQRREWRRAYYARNAEVERERERARKAAAKADPVKAAKVREQKRLQKQRARERQRAAAGGLCTAIKCKAANKT